MPVRSPPTFAELGLAEAVLRGLDPARFPAPTGLQQRAIPPFLQRRDLCAVAAPQDGRLAAWVLPLLQRLCDPVVHADPKEPRALVVVPVHDAAEAVGREIDELGRYVPVRQLVATESGGWNHQVRELRAGVDVLVGTPRRLRDLLRQRAVALRAVDIAVFDELDQLLDRGAETELDRIVADLRANRQIAAFLGAATPEALQAVRVWLREPVAIDCEVPAATGSTPAPPAPASAPPPVTLPDWLDDAEPAARAAPVELPGWLAGAPPLALPGWLDGKEPAPPAAAPAPPPRAPRARAQKSRPRRKSAKKAGRKRPANKRA